MVDCKKFIDYKWGSSASVGSMTEVVNKIRDCTFLLGQGNKSKRVSLRKEISASKKELNIANSCIKPDSWPRIRKLENRLDCLLDKEEMYWKQWSRSDWLQNGDRNTKFFHMKASTRRAHNSIKGLRDMGVGVEN